MRSCQLPAGGRHRLLRPVAADEAAVLHEHWRLSCPFTLATWGTPFLHLAKYHPAGLRKRTIITILSASSRRHLSLIKDAPSEYSLGMARQQPRRLERPTGSLAGHARSTSSCGYANRGIPPGTSTVMRPQQARQLIFMTNILNFITSSAISSHDTVLGCHRAAPFIMRPPTPTCSGWPPTPALSLPAHHEEGIALVRIAAPPGPKRLYGV
ncbi:hypothetical protein MY8738_006960 [Beauveria namnaoensis]